MPRPKTVRQTTDPVGQKLNQVMAEKNMEGDYAAVAAVFGVKSQSVADWVKFGRISKDRYKALVRWSGRPLHWWFDIDDEPGPLVTRLTAEEPSAVFLASQKWPFHTVSQDDFFALPIDVQREVEGFARGLVRAHAQQKKPAA